MNKKVNNFEFFQVCYAELPESRDSQKICKQTDPIPRNETGDDVR
jgi:hypothetical protein